MPKYSVIIPAYQCERTLANTVESIQDAGLREFEIVIVDDGSTDRTADICRELCAAYSNITYVYQKNSGVSAARNCGIKNASGELLLFIDADDAFTLFDEQKISAYFSDGADMVIFGMEFQYHKFGKCVRKETMSCEHTMFLNLQEIGEKVPYLFERNYLSSACNKIIRRSVLVDNSIFFNTELINYEDLEFSIRAIMCCGSVIALPDVHYIYNLDYGYDRTVVRVKRIPNVILAIDPIAGALLQLREVASSLSRTDSAGILNVVLLIYMDMFICKMKTASIEQVREHCRFFRENKNIAHCLKSLDPRVAFSSQVAKWIYQDNVIRIWMYFRYRNVRNFLVRHMKNMLGKY